MPDDNVVANSKEKVTPKPNGKASTDAEPHSVQEIYINCDDPTLWSTQGKGGKVTRNESGEGGLVFDSADGRETFTYNPKLPKVGRALSVDHYEVVKDLNTKFSIDIGVVSEGETVEWVNITSDEGERPRPSTDASKAIIVPAGQRPAWRTTSLDLAGIVEGVAEDELTALGVFRCTVQGRLYLRSLRVDVSLTAGPDSKTVTDSTVASTPGSAPVAPAVQTPRYLQPQMGGIPVAEPAIYRSLFILETIGGGVPPSVVLEVSKADRWTATGGNVARDTTGNLGATVSFSGSPGSFFAYKGDLNDTAHTDILFNYINTGNFSLDISITSKEEKVTEVQIATAEKPKTNYDPAKKKLRFEIDRGQNSFRATRVNVADLVASQVTDKLTAIKGITFTLEDPFTPKSQSSLTLSSLILLGGSSYDALNQSFRELDQPIDPFDAKLPEAETKPAVGVLTVHRQAWVQKGLALGNLLQSVCLAPGEVTQVAVVDWRRKTRGTSEEKTEQMDQVSSEIDQARAVNQIQTGVAREAQYGGSTSLAAAASAQAGVSMSTLFASGSASASATASSALTAQFSRGTRELEASANTALSERTAEKSQALRSRRQAVVREVSEQEAETLSTRVLANYNRRHTLNIEYFEVLQTYEVRTELVGWERCLFVPLVPLDFENREVIERHRAALTGIFKELGALDLLQRIGKFDPKKDDTDEADRQKTIKDNIERLFCAQAAATSFRILDPLVRTYPADSNSRNGLTYAVSQYDNVSKALGVLPPIGHPNALKIIAELIENEQKRAALAPVTLGKLLNSDRLFLSQQLWLRMNSYRIYRALQGYQIQGQPVSTLIDPTPIGIFGNYLAFRWGFSRSDEGVTARKEFEKTYLKQDPKADKSAGLVVALPTSGVFAEAVLGKGEAAEPKNEARFGKWSEAMIPILPPKIAELGSRDRAKEMDLTGQDFSSSLAQLRSKKLADISHIDKIIEGVGKGDMFRDMGGLSQMMSLQEKLATISGEGATAAGERSVQLQIKVLETVEKLFSDAANSQIAQAAVAEFLLPGAGAAMLKAGAGIQPPEGAASSGGKPAAEDKKPASAE
ncbi:MAG TPA: hypothetical protein VGI60_09470 [Chthoniobacterales bacterium]|jgi:hypothetical protein